MNPNDEDGKRTYKVPYFPTLRRVRSFLEKQDSISSSKEFPNVWCQETSLFVQRLTGLSVIGGKYWGEAGAKDHFWNYDSYRGLYIDLTQDQFRETGKKIVIIPESPHPLQKQKICESFEKELVRTVDDLEKMYIGWEG